MTVQQLKWILASAGEKENKTSHGTWRDKQRILSYNPEVAEDLLKFGDDMLLCSFQGLDSGSVPLIAQSTQDVVGQINRPDGNKQLRKINGQALLRKSKKLLVITLQDINRRSGPVKWQKLAMFDQKNGMLN